VVDLLFAEDRSEPVDAAQFDATMKRAVNDAVSTSRPKLASISPATAR